MDRFLNILQRGLVIALTILAVVYVGDYLLYRIKLHNPKPGTPFEDVKIDRMYAVLQKDGRYEFIPADTITQTCVHSIFPHGGHNPCWYVVRQNNQTIPMVILPMLRKAASAQGSLSFPSTKHLSVFYVFNSEEFASADPCLTGLSLPA